MPTLMPTPICFYFDFISPYAYLAWHRIHAIAEAHGRTVEPVPILFAALLNHWGHKGPAEIPPKRMYVLKDTLRTAHTFGLRLEPPPTHPFNPLLGLRIASLDVDASTRRAVIDALFAATWGGGDGITDAASVARIASTAGIDDAIARAAEPAAKARVGAATDAALAAGVFGVPTMVCDDELFWGVDSLHHLERFLRGEMQTPGDAEILARWGSLKASATR